MNPKSRRWRVAPFEDLERQRTEARRLAADASPDEAVLSPYEREIARLDAAVQERI